MERLKEIVKAEIATAKQNKQIEIYGFFRRVEEGFKQDGYREELSGVKSILIIRADVIGDFVITTGFIREVRRNFPRAHITLAVSKAAEQLAARCPYVNEVLSFDGDCYSLPFLQILDIIYAFCESELLHRHFSLALCPQWGSDNLPSLLAAYLSGARERVGYGQFPGEAWVGKRGNKLSSLDDFFLTKKIITPPNVITEAEKNYYLLRGIGLSVLDTRMELWYDDADALVAKRLLTNIDGQSRKIILGLGAGHPNRKYPIEQWLAALSEIAKDRVIFIIVGGEKEVAAANTVAEHLPSDKVLNLVGRTSLRETAAIVSAADMYIGNVTGVMHMAAAANKPVLTIYHEAKDKFTPLPGLLSEYARFPAWQTPVVALRPEKAVDECADNHYIYGGCVHNEAHCIKNVPPQEVIDGYKALVCVNFFGR